MVADIAFVIVDDRVGAYRRLINTNIVLLYNSFIIPFYSNITAK